MSAILASDKVQLTKRCRERCGDWYLRLVVQWWTWRILANGHIQVQIMRRPEPCFKQVQRHLPLYKAFNVRRLVPMAGKS